MEIYQLKKEFFPKYGISPRQWDRRKKDLMLWLENFFDYEIKEGQPIYIVIHEEFGEYQQLPRKEIKQQSKTLEKQKDYMDFTIASLGVDFKPNSKSKIAREAISEFGYDKYHHTSQEAIARRYVSKPFDTYGETNEKSIWVYYGTYQPLDKEILEDWRHILSDEKISEEEAANAFYRQEQGQDISKEKSYYKNAMDRFLKKYKDVPVLVKEWKLKKK